LAAASGGQQRAAGGGNRKVRVCGSMGRMRKPRMVFLFNFLSISITDPDVSRNLEFFSPLRAIWQLFFKRIFIF
jgi:hypothetical protein